MSYDLPQHHYAPSAHQGQRSNQDGDEWEPGGHVPYTASSFAYNVSAPATTSQQWAAQTPATIGYHAGYYQSSSTQANTYGPLYGTHHSNGASPYVQQQTLPPPQPSPYGRGPSSLVDYHYSRTAGYDLSPITSTSPGWDATPGGTTYPSYPFDEGSDSGTSEPGDPSPLCDTGNPPAAGSSKSKSTKEKKWICYRVNEPTATTCNKSFARKADLQRHEQCVHDKHKMERIDCTVRKCARKGDNGFLRRDHLTEHLRHFHSKDIPKKHRRSISQAEEGEEEDDPQQTQPQPQVQQYFN